MRQQKISSSLLAEGKGGMTCLLTRGGVGGGDWGTQLPGFVQRSEVDSDLANESNVNFEYV